MKTSYAIRMIYLQISIFIFALSNVFFKFASSAMAKKGIFSLDFILQMAGGVGCLFLFALIWQQVLKYFELNVANAIKVSYLLWGSLFAIIIFKEKYRLSNFIGMILIMIGIILIILKSKKKETNKE